MAKTRSILKRQLEARAKIWPDITNQMLWDRTERDGFSTIPRTMPLIMNIMDGLSEKGFPVGQTYLELWCRLYDELFLTLNRPEEMAFFAGFTGQRAVRTWRDRVKRLANMGFINLKSGPLGEMSYAVFFNPYHVIKRAYLKKLVPEDKYRALVIRANEIAAFDLDDLDEQGKLIVEEDEDDEEEEEQEQAKKKPAKKIIRPTGKRPVTKKAKAKA